MTLPSVHSWVSYVPESQTVTRPPPYSPSVISPSKPAYDSGWSSVWTASRFTDGSRGRPLGTAHETRTPSRSSRKSQCRALAWCSWTTKVSSAPGTTCPGGGTGSAVRAGSRLAR